MKFKYLKIDLESKTMYTCHAANPHKVDFAWLKDNPGNLFNNKINVEERGMMLRNERNSSCELNCWSAEDKGAVSPRMYQQGQARTHSDVVTSPEVIDLTIGADCNLTCSYCCKEFSSAWRRDVVENGNYPVTDTRYQADTKDKILLKVSQPELKATEHYQTLLNEIVLAAPKLRKLTVTGGEPFLDNKLIDTIAALDLDPTAVVEIYTGLGVNIKRFEKILDQLIKLNTEIIVSAESIGKHLEFNRYGIKWDDFSSKIELLKSKNVKFRFQSTVTNLTIFGFADFIRHFSGNDVTITFAYQPSMMAPYVLDEASKNAIRDSISTLPDKQKNMILHSISATPTNKQREDAKTFIAEFVRRRPDISLDIFPTTFITWLGLDNVVQ